MQQGGAGKRRAAPDCACARAPPYPEPRPRRTRPLGSRQARAKTPGAVLGVTRGEVEKACTRWVPGPPRARGRRRALPSPDQLSVAAAESSVEAAGNESAPGGRCRCAQPGTALRLCPPARTVPLLLSLPRSGYGRPALPKTRPLGLKEGAPSLGETRSRAPLPASAIRCA